ncbi:acylphosphatase [Latilactobacillus curvatus]|uniref:Acylphosphatase n=1 Tax=Latilactobacillus curvatus TaxID=28038 RepID=A0A385AG26_LATCU|nr:acylphosphatase [Latilactobacillus curvatus]AXN36645.1 acylphosphatase [Latilactobacillus curvatus]
MRRKLVLHGDLTDGGVKYVAQRIAMKMHLTGISYKNGDGTISVEIQGLEADIDRYKNEISKGNQFFKILAIDEIKIDEVKEKSFRVG